MVQKVLVVEDYADLNSAITAALSNDYRCTSVRTAEDAIGKLRSDHYEVILLAPRLPIQEDPVMHFLHEQQPDEVHKVILMVAPDEDDDPEAEECRVLVKPFNRDELVAEMAKGE
jgi:DNA-binding response OmpR family regulator